MKTGHVIDALMIAHPWISKERMRDLLLEQKNLMSGQFPTPFEAGRALLFRLDVLYGSDTTPDEWFHAWSKFRS